MSIFSKLFKRRDEEIINTDELVNDVLLKAMLRGEKIDKDKALSLPAVSSAVDRITNTIAMIPIKLYKETIDKNTGKKKVEEVKNDPRINLLNIDTGDTLDAFQMKKAWIQDYWLDKGCYIFIDRTKNKVNSLRYVDARNILQHFDLEFNFSDSQLHDVTTILFCSKNSSGTPWRFINARLDYLKLYKSGVLIHDLVPVVNTNNIAGLYDIVNRKFLRSQGDEDFVAGPKLTVN